MNCTTCGKPATQYDLCHKRSPVCDVHAALGHQFMLIPKPNPKKPKDDEG